jgi:hypothetical protein
VGYTGVDYIDFEGKTWLEWGYRLVPECRGLGYATEASQALLAKAHQTYAGELLAIIAPENLASQNVCHKLGFTFWKQAPVEGDIRNLYTLPASEPQCLSMGIQIPIFPGRSQPQGLGQRQAREDWILMRVTTVVAVLTAAALMVIISLIITTHS